MRKLFLPFAMTLFFAGAAVASPFADVPPSHWSYEAVKKLGEAGIFQGTTDGKFAGQQKVTRHELAVTTARMLAKMEQVLEGAEGSKFVSKEEFATFERLKVEYADELAALGIRVGKLEEEIPQLKQDVLVLRQDVDKVKTEMGNGSQEKVSISGDLLVRHSDLSHKDDWAANGLTGAVRPGNSNNVLTESQFRFRFTAQVDENITAVARWVMFAKNAENVNAAASSARGGAYGIGGIGNQTVSDNVINLAHLIIKNMFDQPGTVTLGRVIYTSNHGLLLNNYLDVARYARKVGDVDMMLQTVFDRHIGSYKDDGPVDYRPVVNLDLKTKWRDHSLYLGLFAQDEPSLAIRRGTNFARQNAIPTVAQLGAGVLSGQTSDSRRDVEFGSKGLIGKNQHWNYDLALVYSDYSIDMANDATTAANPYRDVDMQGWSGLIGAGYDSKKAWAGKVSYAFTEDESMGAISIINDMRYVDFAESPTEDIGRGNAYFPAGLQNMSDLKLQAEYKPTGSKHYARLAWDILDELKDSPVNDLNRYRAGNGLAASVPVADKTNTIYDRSNNFGIADPSATVLTGEYRYQLAKNTRIRVGATIFDFSGDAVRATAGTPAVSAGRGRFNDFDYTFIWSEILSKF